MTFVVSTLYYFISLQINLLLCAVFLQNSHLPPQNVFMFGLCSMHRMFKKKKKKIKFEGNHIVSLEEVNSFSLNEELVA